MSFLPRSLLALAMTAVIAATAGASAPQPYAGHPAAASSPVTEVVSFGDSWSDAGTFGYVYGTSGSGSWTQLLAQEYGADQEPNRRVGTGPGGAVSKDPIGGLDYAEGGAVVAPATGHRGVPPRSVPGQLAAFLRQHGGFGAGQLVTVWAGANDILAALSGTGDPDRAGRFAAGQLTAAELAGANDAAVAAAQREASLVSDMLAAHASRVAVLTVIDQGITAQAPGIQAGGDAEASAVTDTYNRALVRALPDDPRVHLVDVAALFDAIRADPAAYGFAVIDGDACTNGGPRCGPDDWKTPDADRTYAFAAYGHFTTATRELVADFVHDDLSLTWGW